ncbi:uncharacterized protein LOC114755681 [Neltuma alba]|uniref:uncharacterized protein LOC114755681 n=1 Tax=Neltuma alba TaxID=207710 RepID=UPI0010A3F098|nr:uncharacterized protein LOC114755681 [Prosopis alba]
MSSLFKAELPVKCQDPGSYTIPCTIGKIYIKGALLDLGAAINVMPWLIYLALGINGITDTSVVLQLVDRSIRYPKRIIEDILVQVKDLVFPADFYVLDMSNQLANESTLILGRPFLSCGDEAPCINSLKIYSMLSISQDLSFPSSFDSIYVFTTDVGLERGLLANNAGIQDVAGAESGAKSEEMSLCDMRS